MNEDWEADLFNEMLPLCKFSFFIHVVHGGGQFVTLKVTTLVILSHLYTSDYC